MHVKAAPKSIPFPLPAAAEADPGNPVSSGEPVELLLRDGRRVGGALRDLDLELGIVSVVVGQQPVPRAVGFEEVKTLRLPKSRFAAAPGKQPPRQGFNVELKGGGTLFGVTLGIHQDSAGLYLFPSEEKNHFTCLFVPGDLVAGHRLEAVPDEISPVHDVWDRLAAVGEPAEVAESADGSAQPAVPETEAPEAEEVSEWALPPATDEKPAPFHIDESLLEQLAPPVEAAEEPFRLELNPEFLAELPAEQPLPREELPESDSPFPVIAIAETPARLEFTESIPADQDWMEHEVRDIAMPEIQAKIHKHEKPHADAAPATLGDNQWHWISLRMQRANAVVNSQELERALERQKLAPNLKLGEILVEEGLITAQQLEETLEAQKQNRKVPIGELLLQKGLVKSTDIQQALAKKLNIPFVDVNRFDVDYEAVELVPAEMARKYRILPLCLHRDKLVLAMENPMSWEPLDAVRFHTKKFVEPVMASAEELEKAILRAYSPAGLDRMSLADYETTEEEAEDERIDEATVSDNVVVKLVNKIIYDAYQKGASDIHIEPYGHQKTVVRIRRDGTLMPFFEVPQKMRSAVIARIKIMASLDTSERRKPQDGKIDFKKFGGPRVELRVATVPTAGGMEDVVLRILANSEPLPIEGLGLTPYNLEELRRLIVKPYGLFLVSGPTGSGKTTTLHSILKYLNNGESKIWTAEDPVEITQAGLRQVQINPKVGLTFATAMRAFLRADPDIIMVGEMRDQETTRIAIEASLTGHLVFATLHTNSAPESVTRLLDMGMDPFSFSDALVGVLAQRLTKRLCPDCREPYHPDEEEIDDLLTEYCQELVRAPGSDPEKLRTSVLDDWKQRYAADSGRRFTLYRARGCSSCGETGFRGRVGIHELLTASADLKRLIVERAPVHLMTEHALADGMRTLKQDGIDKVLQGLTDIQQVRKVCVK